MRLSNTVLILGILAAPAISEAKVFRNAYVSFELPNRWDCNLEQTEWVCRTGQQGLDSREAVIILTAKEVGPTDGLQAYEGHLKTPRTIASRSGQPLQSQVLKVEQRQIANHPWVDGMHLSSEVPNYYTRYLATTKDKIAILVTFSAHKLHYTKYSNDFLRAIMSLRVIATRSSMNANNGVGGSGQTGTGILGGNVSADLMPTDMEALPEEGGGGSGAGTAQAMIGIALLLAAVGIYLLMKRNKNQR